MRAYIRSVTLDCPDAQVLAPFYTELMLMPTRLLDTPERVVIGNDASRTRLAFATVDGYRSPTWPDPAYPQQLHLCGPTCVIDPDTCSPDELVVRLGATRRPDVGGDCPVYTDPAGHPFCLCARPPYGPEEQALSGQMGSIVFDCFESPRQLASFYTELLDMPVRIDDQEGWVKIRTEDWSHPTLAFQGADGEPPAWPDPARPHQVHLDIEVDDLAGAKELVSGLGATKLRDPSADRVVYSDPEGHPFCLCASD